jgi:S-(hydroxymethyl)glutathione dehydrogenase/alcohol dehydrogenase
MEALSLMPVRAAVLDGPGNARIETTEQAIAALDPGGAAVVVGLPPTSRTARFDPRALAEANQRILGSNHGSVDPQRDIPRLIDLFMEGELDLDALVSGRRPLHEAADAPDDLVAGRALRTLLFNDNPRAGHDVDQR